MTEQELQQKLAFMCRCLMMERLLTDEARDVMRSLSDTEVDGLWVMYRALANTRQVAPPDTDFLRVQDEVLQYLIEADGIAGMESFVPALYDEHILLWQGDITRCAVDAIVNAANSQLLGCWQPGHLCIDNCIHTFAGVQLREECAQIMQRQGHDEPTGSAKVTKAYNLPCKNIIHTVGPVVSGRPTDGQRRQLASCYESCLEAARSCGAKSVAFCCISTGIFGFPQVDAARIAVDTVRAWLKAHSTTRLDVVFNVFLDEDAKIYQEILENTEFL